MRICVLGAGAIGGLLAARLARSGQDVSLLARGESLSAIGSEGLKLVEPDGSMVVATDLVVSDDLSSFGGQDLVILALKAHQIAAIARRLPELYHSDTVVMPLQNGVPWWFFQKFPGPFSGLRLNTLDHDGTIESTVPADRIVASIAYPAAERRAPGLVCLIEGDRFPVGELDGQRSERAADIAHALTGAGFKSRVLTDIRAHLWIKAWGNLAFNPISALTGASLEEICRFPATRSLARNMMLEASEIAAKLGLELRLSVDQRIEGAEKVGNHKTSMLQDVEAGQTLEVEPLIGSFIELGRITGSPTPATESVYALVSLLNSRITAARTGS
ncbi:MAG: 2-dehydropantoate 2-reductase [Acidimicrobiaceae bacterium]|nr:2-dehydropantoate 2-reductase [Acidimicrobiaceae bacterium]